MLCKLKNEIFTPHMVLMDENVFLITVMGLELLFFFILNYCVYKYVIHKC